MKILALILLSALCAFAQSNASDAAMEGYVQDASGVRISNAQVAARNLSTNVETTAASDGQGYFRFPLLKVGLYELRVNTTGFNELKQTGISLSVGKQARIHVDLKVGGTTDSVTVSADASIVEQAVAAQGKVTNERAVRSLPITSRNVYNFHLLGPGTKGIPSTGFDTTQFTFGGSN